jgi:hypothetical protein
VTYNTIADFSSLHVLLTLDFIGEVAYGTDFHALSRGSDCRMLQLFEIILPELMKCGLFPLERKIRGFTRDKKYVSRNCRIEGYGRESCGECPAKRSYLEGRMRQKFE